MVDAKKCHVEEIKLRGPFLKDSVRIPYFVYLENTFSL